MTKVLMIDPDKCTSCRLCELACSARYTGVYRPARARIRVEIQADEAFYFPRVCIQCDEAPCIEECPAEALVRDPDTNVVVLKEDLCDGCGACESACPYGVIWCLDDQAHKCDLCGGDPECVRFCAPGALRYERQTLWPQSARQAYTDRLRDLAQEVKV